MIAGMVIRCDGSTTNILDINRRASPENHGGNSYSALKIFLYICIKFSSLKGRHPASKAYKITPHDHVSAFEPS
ncbi:hypothetical protein HanIR_Chr04g0156681 [Helianthus annuus]|nr:hypothetical protein HanIR_Chr04g0156681 [Helianthus annuus]